MTQDVDSDPHCERDNEAGIEITPGMIEAGKAVLLGEPSVFAGPLGVDCDAGDLVSRVYLAMVRVRLS